ncbi:Intraflagellar transport protein 88 [Cichlidogyrus casuarinus]|uniref:Intraflagellar transport protein 88 n=1 Tax=Cichlidogyrus casuarinus TaxID=1844966 RepID=A0ABD2QI29_9PLAT
MSNLLSGSSEFITENKFEETIEYKIRQMEMKINSIIDESCILASKRQYDEALEKAKEAHRSEKILLRHREQNALSEQINLDLNYSILFNLANRYTDKGMLQEALNIYSKIVKNKSFINAGRLKVNMGNIHFTMRNYEKAIKFYRMGLDQVPNAQKKMRLSIMRNIGIAFVKLGKLDDAISAFEHIMKEETDVKSGFNLILCHFLKKDEKGMRVAFEKLLRADLPVDDDDRYIANKEDNKYGLILDVIRNDSLRKYEKQRQTSIENAIKMAAKIIAPVIEEDFQKGYDWCIDKARLSDFHEIAHDLEIDKAVMFLKQREFQAAIQILKSFQKKDYRIACTAATNLSFLYFLEGDYQEARMHAEKALQADHYNPFALVNMGNVLYKAQQYDQALDRYREALEVDSSCFEALFNAGLAYKRLNRLEEALETFGKLNKLAPNDPSVLYQLMDLNEQIKNFDLSHHHALQLHSVASKDPQLLKKLGEYYSSEDDEAQALHFYQEAFKCYPCEFDVIEWLGTYYVRNELCEQAVAYFEKAALLQPNEARWPILIASCHRRTGDYKKAMEKYEAIHRKFPENTDCLEFLVRLCSDMAYPEAEEYSAELKKLKKMKEIREQRQISAQSRRGSTARTPNSREGSAGGVSSEAGSREESRGRKRSALKSNAPALGMMRDLEETDALPPTSGSRSNFASSYQDPIGPTAERPRTAAKSGKPAHDDFFADEDLDEDLLPE